MKKVILAPDSFKGSMSSAEVCEIIKAELLSGFPNCEVISVPIADGGEGSVDCFMTAVGGKKIALDATGPFFERITCDYGILKDGKTAVIEMAACCGLPLANDRLNPETATTYGVGELIADAVARGCRNIILGLGGSCTNDGGTGAAAALGVKFFDQEGKSFTPTGGTLGGIKGIDISGSVLKNSGVVITAMCDVENPLYGERGAAHVFAPQKGADGEMVDRLDKGLKHLCGVINTSLGIDVSSLAGGGAAGGMGAGAYALLGAELKPGIRTVLERVDFETKLAGADMVITGEGRLDDQTLGGKAIIGVAQAAKRHNVPVIAVVGDISDPIEEIYKQGVTAVLSINRVARPFAEVKQFSKRDLRLTVQSIIKLIKLGEDSRE